jgi:polysaccharide deacetylase family protein (PEP-CTERM system associated)
MSSPDDMNAPVPAANALTIDVEDYFQVSALAPYVSRAHWDSTPSRVEGSMDLTLSLLRQASVTATFFTLGWIAERYPSLIRRIASEGHEIASHGYGHHRASDQSAEVFLHDIRLAKELLQDVTGYQVKGYRAPSFSIGRGNLWAFDCIAQAGYRYSSSVYPVRHDHYGMPDAPRFAFQPRAGLTELPVTTSRVFKANFPAGGGGYFRLMPYPVSRWLIRRVNQVDKKPAVFYFHPWELDSAQPRVPGIDAKTRFRHYLNLHRTEHRLRRLLSDFKWDRMDRVFHDELGA